MSNARTLLGSGSAVAFARLFSLACAAAQLPLLTRLLSPSEYATVAVAIAISAYFSFSAEPVVLSFERYPGSAGERATYKYALVRSLSYLAVAAIVVLAIAYPLGHLEEAIAFVGWGIGLEVNRLISLAWLMWERPWQYAFNLMAGTGARTAVLLVLVVFGWDPLLSLGAAGVCSAAVALIVSPRVPIRGLPKSDWSRPWPFSFGINLSLAALAYILLTNGNLLILSVFVSKDLVGRYAVMLQVSTLTSAAALGLILAVAYPPLRLAWDNGRRELVQMSLTTLQTACVAIASATVFVCYVGDHFLLKLVVPASYVDSAVLAPLIMATAFATMGGMASWQHQLEFKAGRVARRTVGAAVVGVTLTIFLTSFLHERGAAIGAVVGFLIYLVVMHRGTRLPVGTVALAIVAMILTSNALVFGGTSSDLVAYPALAITAATSLLTFRRYLVSARNKGTEI